MTLPKIAHEWIVPYAAVEDPAGYDNGQTELAIMMATRKLNEILNDSAGSGSAAALGSAFREGALVFAGLLTRCHGQPTMAADILREMGYDDCDCSNLDEYDKQPLREVNKERGMRLRGLKPNTQALP